MSHGVVYVAPVKKKKKDNTQNPPKLFANRQNNFDEHVKEDAVIMATRVKHRSFRMRLLRTPTSRFKLKESLFRLKTSPGAGNSSYEQIWQDQAT